jgi:hypothetical protein
VHWTEDDYRLYQIRHRAGPRTPQGSDDAPEARLLAQVAAEAKRQGYAVHQAEDSHGSTPGFPRLVLCNGKRLLFVVLKRHTGKLTLEQTTWLNMLRHTGVVEAYEWHPGDWSKVVETLRGAAPHGEQCGER